MGQGPTALVVGAGEGCLDIFSLIYHFSFLSPSLWETTRYRLKYCLNGPLNPQKTTNQPTSLCRNVLKSHAKKCEEITLKHIRILDIIKYFYVNLLSDEFRLY